MLTLKTSIYVLAVTAGLTLGCAPQIAFADDAPTGSSMGGVASPDSPVGEMEKHLDDINKAAAKLNPPKKVVVVPPPPPPPPPPAPPSFWQGIVDTVAGWLGVGEEDEAKAQKAHNDAVHKAVEDMHKAQEEQKKLEQKAAAAPPSTEKTVDLKNVETRKESLEIPTLKPTTKLVTLETPNSTELRIVDLKNVEAKNELNDVLTLKSATKLVSLEAPTSTELKTVDIKNVETKKESLEVPTHPSTTKLVSLEAPKARTLITPRVTVTTTVGHLTVGRPTISAPRVTVNVPRPTINIPHPTINIPVIVRR